MSLLDRVLKFLFPRQFGTGESEPGIPIPPEVRLWFARIERQEQEIKAREREETIDEQGEPTLEETEPDFEDFEEDEERGEREDIREGVQYRRKIIKSVFYCEGRTGQRSVRINLRSTTFEANGIDRMDELLREVEIIRKYQNCYQLTEWGYSDNEETDNPPFKFPIIEVGEE